MIYRITITKAGEIIFSHDILLQEGYSFAKQFAGAMDSFRETHVGISLLDDDVALIVGKAIDF